MKVSGILAALLLSLSLTGCQTMENAAAAPFNMLGRLFDAGGRTLHLNSANDARPGGPNIEAREIHEAVAVMTPMRAPDPVPADRGIAQR